MTRNPVTKDYAVTERLIHQCSFCSQEWAVLRWCSGRNIGHFKFELPNWTSGNSEIDDFIHEAQIIAEFPNQVLGMVPGNSS